MVVDRPTAICALSPLRAAILILTIIAVLLLAAILVLLLYRRGRVPLWPYYYPVWVRRHRRYKKNRRF
jgi:hypothetical protein